MKINEAKLIDTTCSPIVKSPCKQHIHAAPDAWDSPSNTQNNTLLFLHRTQHQWVCSVSSAPKHELISIIMPENNILSKNKMLIELLSWVLYPPPFPPTHHFSPLCFSSFLWSFLPGYLLHLDYKLFEARDSILRGLKNIFGNLGHSIKELFINKGLLQDESDLSVMTLTSMQHIPCTVVKLTILGRGKGVVQSSGFSVLSPYTRSFHCRNCVFKLKTDGKNSTSVSRRVPVVKFKCYVYFTH